MLGEEILQTTPEDARSKAAPWGLSERLWLEKQLLTLNSELLTRASATDVLQAICAARWPGAPILARAAPGDTSPRAADRARCDLGGADAPLAYRRVDLMCGEAVLSHAENWYLPDRLTPEMNARLAESETPFGVVARALRFERRNLTVHRLFRPLPADWDRLAPPALDNPPVIPLTVLLHRAVLVTPDGAPFSVVSETYTSRVLAPYPSAAR